MPKILMRLVLLSSLTLQTGCFLFMEQKAQQSEKAASPEVQRLIKQLRDSDEVVRSKAANAPENSKTQRLFTLLSRHSRMKILRFD